jgi:methionine-R-sulfoxide reductase
VAFYAERVTLGLGISKTTQNYLTRLDDICINTLDEIGEYYCAVCGNHLFRSSSKFASTCGWPSFFEADKEGVSYKRDSSHGMERIEVLCKRCDSHLGHVFNDGPMNLGKREKRYCINSASLKFIDKEKMITEGYQSIFDGQNLTITSK